MHIALWVLVFIASAVVLVKSSKGVVDNALRFSKLIGVSTFAIGFIVLSISTSLPELGVAIFSVLGNAPELSLGTIFGANVADLTLILSACVFLGGTVYLQKKEISGLIELLAITMVATLLIFFSGVSFLHGIVFLAFFAFLIRRLYKKGRIPRELVGDEHGHTKTVFAKLLFSIFLLLLASKFLVDSALNISSALLVPKTVFGALAVALSTTLPELSVELRAIKKKEYALAMGDLFGSAVTNITLVLGTLILLSPTRINAAPLLGAFFAVLIAIAFIWIALTRKGKITRKEAAFLLALYAIFVIQELELVALKIV